MYCIYSIYKEESVEKERRKKRREDYLYERRNINWVIVRGQNRTSPTTEKVPMAGAKAFAKT